MTPSGDGNRWILVDLLGRSMGCVTKTRGKYFTIQPDGHAVETMADMKLGPFNSLDAALAEVERHTRGTCRMASGSGEEKANP